MAELTDFDLIADRIADKLSKSWIENDKFVDALVSKVTETVVSQVSEKIVCCNPTEYEEKFGVTPAKQRDLLQKLDRWFCMLEDSKSIIRTTHHPDCNHCSDGCHYYRGGG